MPASDSIRNLQLQPTIKYNVHVSLSFRNDFYSSFFKELDILLYSAALDQASILSCHTAI